jgi:uncharacterized protein
MRKALIIFVKNPMPGKVKTRLAATLGADKALQIYQKLLQHTCAVTSKVPVDKYVFYSDAVDTNDIWLNEIYQKKLQLGDDLGERMKNAFEYLFRKEYEMVVIIGSDCYELTGSIIEQAFDGLLKAQVVIGPAADGGYYLLGMQSLVPDLFAGKNWSTSSVYQETMTQLRELRYKVHELAVLNDVDVPADITFDY